MFLLFYLKNRIMEKYDDKYMQMAKIWAQNSHAIRAKVGALVVKDNTIISDGYNGTPTGFDNTCEILKCRNYIDRRHCPDYKDDHTCEKCKNMFLESKQTVIHAECNAITKLARGTQSSVGSTLYVTLSPCIECAKMIIQSGIKRVVYGEKYRIDDGIKLLEDAGIIVEQFNN